jgi:hypothetical protein
MVMLAFDGQAVRASVMATSSALVEFRDPPRGVCITFSVPSEVIDILAEPILVSCFCSDPSVYMVMSSGSIVGFSGEVLSGSLV